MPKLTPDGELLDAHMTAQFVALRALVRCLEDRGALKPGQYADALPMAMETGRDESSDMTLAGCTNCGRRWSNEIRTGAALPS